MPVIANAAEKVTPTVAAAGLAGVALNTEAPATVSTPPMVTANTAPELKTNPGEIFAARRSPEKNRRNMGVFSRKVANAIAANCSHAVRRHKNTLRVLMLKRVRMS